MIIPAMGRLSTPGLAIAAGLGVTLGGLLNPGGLAVPIGLGLIVAGVGVRLAHPPRSSPTRPKDET